MPRAATKTSEEAEEFPECFIRPEDFYRGKAQKTKLRWFCYEIALCFASAIDRKLGKRLSKRKIHRKDICGFSIHAAEQMKQVVLKKLSGEIETMYFSYTMVEEYFPSLDDKTSDMILRVVYEAWDEQLAMCEMCPVRCISEKDAYCSMFDDGPYGT
jgi:hypothetical protein